MTITTKDLQHLFALIAEDIAKTRDHLCELDGVIGDGDHGLAMDAGCQAAAKAVGELDPAQTAPTPAFNVAAKAFLNAVGASSGPLYATAFMRAGAAAKDKHALTDDDFLRAFAAMAQESRSAARQSSGKKQWLTPGGRRLTPRWIPGGREHPWRGVSTLPTGCTRRAVKQQAA